MAEFHSFYCWVIFHYIHIHSYVDGHLGCFHILPAVHNATVNNGVHVSFQISVSSLPPSLPSSASLESFFTSLSFFHPFFLFDIYPEAGSCDSCIFVFFWGCSILFFHNDLPIYISTNSIQGFCFLQSLPTFVMYRLFDDGPSDMCAVIPHYGWFTFL